MMDEIFRVLNHTAPEFPKGFKWLNATRQISMSDLRGCVVVLDFWTYCCINCMHMAHTLEKLEDYYRGKPVVIIGVHSAKFKNEQDPDNIREAISRYEMRHPVIVDEKMHMWHEYFVNSWPTLVIIGPDGKIKYKRAGEVTPGMISAVIDHILEESSTSLAKEPPKIFAEQERPARKLRYPGKLCMSPDSTKIAISNSNANEIVIVDAKSLAVLDTVGNGARGISDGSLEASEFYRPQGLEWVGNRIYVADTENNAVREINLDDRTVATILGTGRLGQPASSWDFSTGTKISINSPWDLSYDEKSGSLFIAMAGTHQIWKYIVRDGTAAPYAGNSAENIIDGNLEKASFAQPSGIWVDGNEIYVADSEASAIRSINMKDGYVSTITGSGLFTFGEQDGSLASARLQHPIGVSARGGLIYVADTYNSAIRQIDVKGNRITTLVSGPGKKSACRFGDPKCDTLQLYEPNDVKPLGSALIIADTNNNLIRRFDMDEKILETLQIKWQPEGRNQ